MQRRLIRPAFAVAFSMIAWLHLALGQRPSDVDSAIERPNVLLILTDDQGWGDLGVHDNPLINTPAIDKLASQSVRLQRFYVSPVCAPTRAALLTGRYPERTGVSGVTGRREVMNASETTIAELFQEAGYHTGCFGKWHNGAQYPLHPNGQGFDEFFGFCGGHFNLYDNPILERNGTPVQTEGYITDVLTDAAIEFLDRQETQTPFFCYVPFNAPHGPFQVRQDLFDKYNKGNVSEKTAAVYAMVDNIDQNVDRLLTTLQRRGFEDNTIVLFATDNGPNGKRFNGGMLGAKGSVHEGGCRVPGFIRWPSRLQSRDVHQITAHIDVLPTLVAWCGLGRPTAPLDGSNLETLLSTGSDESIADRVLITYRPNQADLQKFGRAAARSQRWRLTMEKGSPRLFDMTADPGQKVDVASQHPDVVAKLRGRIEHYVSSISPQLQSIRPVPIGHGRPTWIPAVESQLKGEPKFAYGISWAHSWVRGWTRAEDRILLPIDNAQSGQYEVLIDYVSADVSPTVTLGIADAETVTRLPRFVAEHQLRPDLDSQSAPRWMQSFATHSLGTLQIPEGLSTLKLGRQMDSDSEIEFGGVTLRRVTQD